MFTGLIEEVGAIASVDPKGDVWQLDITAPGMSGELKVGDSVSVSGSCSTVTRCGSTSFAVEIMEETRLKTKLGKLKKGARVNLERAMRLDSRLDGHLVSGHIDGLAKVLSIEAYPNTRKYFFSADAEILSMIVPKGSVTVDGISLTVIDAGSDRFSVGIIPTTLSDTTLSELRVGDEVNIETDIIGKYITKFLRARFSGDEEDPGAKDPLTWGKLAEYGWV
jgi:riboflavin synthase